MTERQVEIYRAANSVQAALLRQLLAEHGIRAWVVNDMLAGEGGELPMGIANAPRVVVSSAHAQEAAELTVHFEEQITGRWTDGTDEMIDDSERTIGVWPQCYSCGKKRTTVCPHCGTSGVDFPWADEGDPTEEFPELWLECPVCDSVYEPDYLSRCEWCGYRFPSGITIPVAPAPAFRLDWQARSRMIFVLTATAALLAAVGGYFAWILRR